MYARVNPSGCAERHGLIQVRNDLCLEAGDVRYNDSRFYVVDEMSTAFLNGYKGKVDKDGVPRDVAAYAAWEASLPRVWLADRCFHSHFIYLDPYTLKDEQITNAMALHVPNFYKAWVDEWDKSPGGMRHGWDVATRIRPERFNLTHPELYVARQAECLSKLDILKASSLVMQVKGIGETFPATAIDVGAGAIDRGGAAYLRDNVIYTVVDGNNAANADGSIDTGEIWLNTDASDATNSGLWFGTFSDGGSNVLTCRDSEGVGTCAAGSKQTFTGLDITIVTGDYIGAAHRGTDSCLIEKDATGFTRVWQINQECIDPSDSTTFTSLADDAASLYGTGATPPQNYERTSALSLGLTAGASKSWGTSRTSALALGLAVGANRLLSIKRTAATALGLAVAASRVYGRQRTAALSLGVAVLGDRLVAFKRTAATALGLAVAASRVYGRQRTSNLSLGISVAASRTRGRSRTSELALGLAVAATRQIAYKRSAAVALGITVLGARLLSIKRSAATALGIAVTGARTVGRFRTSNLKLGITVQGKYETFWKRLVIGTVKALYYVKGVVKSLYQAQPTNKEISSVQGTVKSLYRVVGSVKHLHSTKGDEY